ncbi:hypothetical protein GNT69_02685 [Bacillus sp. B15-48]|nr:hypothetical protein [Bacillus sp. B15-48]
MGKLSPFIDVLESIIPQFGAEILYKKLSLFDRQTKFMVLKSNCTQIQQAFSSW